MKVRDILYHTAVLLGENALASALKAETEESDAELKLKTRNMLIGYNAVIKEIAIDYLPLTNSETLHNTIVYYSSLSHKPCKILGGTNLSGRPCTIRPYATYLVSSEKDFILEYNYIPQDRAISDNFDYENATIQKEVIAYGIAVEYSLIEGSYSVAVNWESKYREGLKSIPVKSAKKVKVRRDFV